MKKVFLAVVTAIMVLSGCSKKEVSSITVNSFTWSESGTSLESIYQMEVVDVNGLKTARVSYPYMQIFDLVGTADDDFLKELSAIIEKYDIESWNGFNEIDTELMGGESFSLTIKTVDGATISASGYGSYPTNYSEAEAEIKELFDEDNLSYRFQGKYSNSERDDVSLILDCKNEKFYLTSNELANQEESTIEGDFYISEDVLYLTTDEEFDVRFDVLAGDVLSLKKKDSLEELGINWGGGFTLEKVADYVDGAVVE